MRKKCFKCKRVLPIEQFYEHPRMADGRLGKCQECTRGDVKRNYELRRERYSAYERERNRTPSRRAAKRLHTKQHRARNPLKYKARCATNNAVRDGRLVRQPCRICGAKAQAHHRDYKKPLQVDWLCFKHHREIEHGQVVTDRAA